MPKSYHNIEKTQAWQHKPCHRLHEPQYIGHAKTFWFKLYRCGNGWQTRGEHGLPAHFKSLEEFSKWLDKINDTHMPKVGELIVCPGTLSSAVYRVLEFPLSPTSPFRARVEYAGRLDGGAWRWHHGPRHETHHDIIGCKPANGYSAVSA